MAEQLTGNLESLVLSAAEIKNLTDWPDEMIEDYLNIIRNFSNIAEIVDENDLEIITNIQRLQQESYIVAASLGRIKGVLNGINPKLLNLAQELSLKNTELNRLKSKINLTEDKLNSLSQEIKSNRVEIGKNRALINNLKIEILNFNSIKAALLKIDGAGASDPTINASYNISTVTRAGAGVYEVTLEQSTIIDLDIIDNSAICSSDFIAPTAATDLFEVKISSSSPGVLDIEVFEVTQGAGTDLVLTPYDIVSGDLIDLTLIMSGGSELPPE